MGLLSRVFGGKKQPSEPAGQHAVIVHFEYGQTDLQALFTLEDELAKAISAAAAGEFDGNEVATDGSDGYLYMYGPDGDKLFDAVRPVLDSTTCMRDISVTIRYGPPENGVEQREVQIGTEPADSPDA